MSWHVGLYGEGVLRKDVIEKWHAERIMPADMADFARASPTWFTADFKAQTVKSFLADVAAFNARSGHEYIQLITAENVLTVRAVLSEGYLPDWLERTVAALRAAGRAGFTGQVNMFGLGEPLGAKLTVSRKKATWEVLDGESGPRRAIEELDAISRSRKGQPTPPRADVSVKNPGLPRTVVDELGEVATALESEPAKAVLAAAKSARIIVYIGRQQRLLHEVVDSPAELLAACRGTSRKLTDARAFDLFNVDVAVFPAFAIRILAELDPRVAAPIAMRMFEAGRPPTARFAAAQALARIGGPQAIAQLEQALIAPAGSLFAAEGLRSVKDADLAARVLEEATRRVKKVRKPDADEFANVLDVLARWKHAPAVPFLLSLWESPRIAALRFRAGLALTDVGTKEALEPLVAHVREKDEGRSSVAVLALLRLKPRLAFDELKLAFASKKDYLLAARILAILTAGRDALTPIGSLPVESSLLELDPRWFGLAEDLLADTDYNHSAIALLTVHRRGAEALARRVGKSQDELLCHSLEYIGDRSVLPILEKHVAKRKDDPNTSRIKKTIARLRAGERPSLPFGTDDD